VKNLFFPNLKILEENVIAFNKAFSAPSVQSPLGTKEFGILPPESGLCYLHHKLQVNELVFKSVV
jgi:hypothetical protein